MAKKLTKKRSRSQPLQSESTNHGVSLQEQRKNAAFEFEKLGLCSQLPLRVHGWAGQFHRTFSDIVSRESSFRMTKTLTEEAVTVASRSCSGYRHLLAAAKPLHMFLPILHHLMNSKTMSQTALQSSEYRIAPSSLLHFLSTLIIAPTTELCLQIYNQILLFGESVRIKVGCSLVEALERALRKAT